MAKGTYLGAHTRISLSEDGTVWSTHVGDIGELNLEPTPRRRWENDALRSNPKEAWDSEKRKRAEFRILAEYAREYRERSRPQPVENVPSTLIEFIQRSGGVIDWINADATRLKRFWKFVEEQNNPPKRIPSRLLPPSKPTFRRRRPKSAQTYLRFVNSGFDAEAGAVALGILSLGVRGRA